MIWSLAACTQVDPVLAAKGDAVRAYREGRDATDPAKARVAFATAAKAVPDPLLRAWEAQALADSGELEAAVDLLQTVLSERPGLVEARYNRAAYLARLGRIEEAGAELSKALDSGARRPRQAILDPDFAPHVDHFSFLPRDVLLVTLDVPTDTLFWGNEALVRLRVLGGEAAPVRIDGPIQGPLELVGMTEGVIDTTEGPARELTWTYRVLGAGTSSVGPWTIRSAGHHATVGVRTFTTTAPPGKNAKGMPERVQMPELPEVGVLHTDGLLWVRSRPGDSVEIEPDKPKPLKGQVLDRSILVGQLDRYEMQRPTRVRIRRAGREVYSWP